MYRWPVVPICESQRLDVNKEDIIQSGLYRKCNIYKGGGGYDKFETIYRKRYETATGVDLSYQFVVQLYGCPLKCSYCYVTKQGVFGDSVRVPTDKIVKDFHETELSVFHLMGGAPAFYIDHWWEILEQLNSEKVFHSDLLLVEQLYSTSTLRKLSSYPNQLHALSIKGSTPESFYSATRTIFNSQLFWSNFDRVYDSQLPFYLTFTGMSEDDINSFSDQIMARYKDESLLEDALSIPLVDYNALHF